MVIEDLKQAFNNAVFYKSGMIKNCLDSYFGNYEHRVRTETNNYFIVEMTPKPFTKNLNKISVKFEFIGATTQHDLHKICNISIIK